MSENTVIEGLVNLRSSVQTSRKPIRRAGLFLASSSGTAGYFVGHQPESAHLMGFFVAAQTFTLPVLHTIARACMGCVEGNTETEPNPNLKELALRRGPDKQRQASQVCEQSVKG